MPGSGAERQQAKWDETARACVGALLAEDESIAVVTYAYQKPKIWLFGLIGAGAAFTMRQYLLVLTTARLFVVRLTMMGQPQQAELIMPRTAIGAVRVSQGIAITLRFEVEGIEHRFTVARRGSTDRLLAELGLPRGGATRS